MVLGYLKDYTSKSYHNAVKRYEKMGMDGQAGAIKTIGVKSGIIDKEKATFSVDKTGAAKADIDYSKVPSEHQVEVKEQGNSLAQGLHNVDREIKELEALQAAGKLEDPSRLSELRVRQSKLQNAFDEFKFQCETPEMGGLEWTVMIVAGAFSPLAGNAVDGLIETEATYEDIQTAYQMGTETNADMTIHSQTAPAPHSDNAGYSGYDRYDHSAKGDMNAFGGATAKRKKAINNATPETIVKRLTNGDPKKNYNAADLIYLMKSDSSKYMAVMSLLQKEHSELVPGIMESVKQHMQQQNRFWQMMSSLHDADHQTKKAILGNFRV